MARKRKKPSKKTSSQSKGILEHLMSFAGKSGKPAFWWVKQVTIIKQVFQKMLLSWGFLIAGLIVVIVGLAEFLETITQGVPPGMAKIVIGIIVIVFALFHMYSS